MSLCEEPVKDLFDCCEDWEPRIQECLCLEEAKKRGKTK
jgi:hypothetical protein